METALLLSVFTALLLASLIRAALPGHLLHSTLGRAWLWWLIHRPLWLPLKPSGDCVFCTAFWVPGLPLAIAASLLTPAGLWALAVPLFVGFLTEFFTMRH
jgi:hypothetical protein